MFTGIVEEIGRVADVTREEGAARLRVTGSRVLDGTRPGDSISVDGCCLTATAIDDGAFVVDVIAETLTVTTTGSLLAGDEVNLERALAVGDRLGGHLVQGHVDGVGEIVAREDRPDQRTLVVRAPPTVTTYLVPKGSVTVAGVSLTVLDTSGTEFSIGLVPHTLSATTLGRLGAGDRVNLEADVIAKYVERLLAGGMPTPYRGASSPPSSSESTP